MAERDPGPHCELIERSEHEILLNVMGPGGPGRGYGQRVCFFWLYWMSQFTGEITTSIHEICDLTGIRSRRAAHKQLRSLEAGEFIEIREWDVRTGKIEIRIPKLMQKRRVK